MKHFIAFAAVLVPVVASAQSLSNPQPSMNEPNYSMSAPDLSGYGSGGDTPTTRRQKTARAIAFREEAARLLNADGGTFTREHQAYLQRKGRAILDGHR